MDLELRPCHNPRFATEETPETLRFRVAVNDLGEIRYCFPINSSGDLTLDEQSALAGRSLQPFLTKQTGRDRTRLLSGLGHGHNSMGQRRRTSAASTGRCRLRRDSRQSFYSCHDLSAAFSCGGVSILDNGRMEPPAARATVSSAPVALRDLRVRI